MKIVVGLGNPGRKYEITRHNIGFEVIDRIVAQHSGGTPTSKFEGDVVQAAVNGQSVLLLRPRTYMNASGRSVRAAVDFYKLELDELLVVCDDFNLPLGKVRLRPRGSAGGQKGLQNIIQQLGTEEFGRLRVGVGPVPDRWHGADFVLSRFTAEERLVIDAAIGTAADAAACWLSDGIDETMNRFN